MAKDYRKMRRKANGKVREVRPGELTIQLPLPEAELIAWVPQALEQLTQEVGLWLIRKMLDEEAKVRVGSKHAKNLDRAGNFWGQQLWLVYLGSTKMNLNKPRIRDRKGHEIVLSSYEQFQNAPRASDLILDGLLAGLSCRTYERVAAQFYEGYGVKRSSVSRKAIRESQAANGGAGREGSEPLRPRRDFHRWKKCSRLRRWWWR